jgi:uncharacterized protein (DUF1778 family)
MKTPKPKRGRPPKAPGETSAALLRLRLPAAELQAIKRAAKAAKQTLTTYVRQKLK